MKEEKIKIFIPDKKAKRFIARRMGLQEMLKEILHTEI